MQQTDRKLIEERRQRQSLETQLNNERKQRKLTEEKLSRYGKNCCSFPSCCLFFRAVYLNGVFHILHFYRIDCSESCKLRKQMLENECKQLRRDVSAIEELKKTAEQQSRTYEQEVSGGYRFAGHVHFFLINPIQFATDWDSFRLS